MTTVTTLIAMAALATGSLAQSHGEMAKGTGKKISCAVMKGTKVDITTATKKKMFADYKGNRYFFCCAGCPQAFRRTRPNTPSRRTSRRRKASDHALNSRRKEEKKMTRTILLAIALAGGNAAFGQHHEPPKEKPKPPAKPADKPKVPPQHEQHQKSAEKPKDKPVQHGGHDMQMGGMKGTQGNWSMARQGSGTSWLPDSSPMFMKMLPSWNGFEMLLMGSASVNYHEAGGPRGESQLFSSSMAMLMMRRAQPDGGVLGFQFMASLDPVFNGKKGYPNLFQTGETEGGMPLKDRQHPHDLFSEIAVAYSRPVGSNMRAISYFGIAGEPALGGPMFMMRPSGMENPESPIGHHWFDSTHISFGVATFGLAVDEKWKFEASAFNGTEPDENRYDIDTIKFDSASGRVSYNPTRDLSMQVSYGYLKEPEAITEPGVSQHRLTASLMHSRQMSNGEHRSLGLTFGRNIKSGEEPTNAFGLEGTYYQKDTAYFARFERVEKDELVGVPPGTYTINKLAFGGVRNIASRHGFHAGVGAFDGLHSFPSSLEPLYGKSPVSLGVFIRVRPSKMKHDMGGMEPMK